MESMDKAMINRNVAIIIPVFNEERYLANCLDSVMELDYPYGDVEVVLVDNGSTDRSIEIASQYKIKILEKPEGKVGAVRNFGVKNSSSDVLVFLDSDCVVKPDWLKHGVERLYKSEALVLGGQYLLRDKPSWIEKNWVLESSENVVHQSTLVGGCIFIRRGDFLKIGMFREELNSGEDSDLTVRLLEDSYNVVIDPTLSVVHLGYPRKVSEFIKRQLWHSADYIPQLPRSLSDKVFIDTCFFLFGLLLSMFSLITLDYFYAVLSLLIVVSSVSLLSIKRVMRAKYRGYAYVSIFLVDLLYLIGRSLGVLKGIKGTIGRSEMKKVARR